MAQKAARELFPELLTGLSDDHCEFMQKVAVIEAALSAAHKGLTEEREELAKALDFNTRTLADFAKELSSLRSLLAQAEGVMNWVNDNFKEAIGPFHASTNHNPPQSAEWCCTGCNGGFISHWPKWEEPTDQTFPHDPKCKYVALRSLLSKLRETQNTRP